jgi:hypothetical protein
MHLDELNSRLEANPEYGAVEMRKAHAFRDEVYKVGFIALVVLGLMFAALAAYPLGLASTKALLGFETVVGTCLMAWMHITLSRASKR